MTRTDIWKEIYARFEPEKPADAQWRADRPESPIRRIEGMLDANLGHRQIYFMGSVGTGKSTELLRLAEARQAKDFVVYIDLVRHFEEVVADGPALYRVSAWELCFLAAVAIWRAAEELLGHKWDAERGQRLMSAWGRVANATGETTTASPKLDLGELARSMAVQASAIMNPAVGAGLTLLAGAVKGGPRWELPLGVGTRTLPDQDSAMQALLEAVNDIIMDVQSNYRRLLLVIDGLDRITDPDRVKSLFIDTALFARLACTLVVCGPNLRSENHAPLIRRFQIRVLCNEPVLDHDHPDDPRRTGPGIAFFRAVFRQRVADLDAGPLISEELLDRLAYYSGGQARMFIKLVRSVAEAAVIDKSAEISKAHVEAALDEQRRLLEMGLHRGHLDLLTKIRDDPDHRLPDDERVWRLLAGLQLAPYPNESEWFYPHPLLTLSLLKPTRPGSAG